MKSRKPFIQTIWLSFYFAAVLSPFVINAQAPAPGPYYFVSDNVEGIPQFYCGDPTKGTYAGVFTMENYNLLATILGDNPTTLKKQGQTLVPMEEFSFKSGSVTTQPFAYTNPGSSKKHNLPIGPNLSAFLSNPLKGASFNLTLPFTDANVGLSPNSGHLRIDDQQNAVHTSVDFSLANDKMFDVVAAADGIIVASGMTGQGPTVIRHTASNGQQFLTIYQHLDVDTKIDRADNSPIKRGDFIGKTMDKGEKTHLHFTVAVKGPSKTIDGVKIPELWYLIDPLGVYDYRRDYMNPATYNYTMYYNNSLPVRGVLKAYVFKTNPLVGSLPAVNNVVEPIVNTLAQITWAVWNTIVNLTSNVFGGGDGEYKLVCYRYKNCSKKYLNWDGDEGHQLKLSSSGTVFKIDYKEAVLGCRGGGGYRISKSNAAMVYSSSGSNNIYMRGKRYCGVPLDNYLRIDDDETWYLWNVGGNRYVLYNWGGGKVLDAHDEVCTGNCDCSGVTSNMINGHNAAANNATQVWILQKQ